MSENYKIGNYEISTKAYYEALQNLGVSSDENLKKLDVNGDKKLTEDELMALDLQEEETANNTTATTNNMSVDEKIAQIEEAYEEKLLAMYEQLDQLRDERLQIYNKIGASPDLETYKSYIQQANSITEQMNGVNDSIVSLMMTAENQITNLKASASLVSADGTYNVSTSNVTPLSSANVSFNFTENLSARQQSELSQFKANWEQNKSRYQSVSAQTGVPAELIAAIHWREASGSFNARLHDGGSLAGYSSWEAAAVNALTENSYGNINMNDITTWYDFAERYNGLGYRNKGVSSPYVWAGTTNYTSGKYVADGVYDAGYVDQQLGVAVMLKALLG